MEEPKTDRFVSNTKVSSPEVEAIQTKQQWMQLMQALLHKVGADSACVILGYSGATPSVQYFDFIGSLTQTGCLDLIDAARADVVRRAQAEGWTLIRGGGTDEALTERCECCGRNRFMVT